MNADTLAWTIAREIVTDWKHARYSAMTGGVSTVIHDRLVPLIEEAMRADANESAFRCTRHGDMRNVCTRSCTYVVKDPTCADCAIWKDDGLEMRREIKRLNLETDRLTGALGEMTFGRVTAEDELKAIKSYGGINDHGVPLPFVLSCRICQSSMWVCAEAYLSADNARRAAQRSRDVISESLSYACAERDGLRTRTYKGMDFDDLSAEVERRAYDVLSMNRKLAQANSERLTDAAIEDLRRQIASYLLQAGVASPQINGTFHTEEITDLIRAARGRTEPSAPPERCTVRVSQAHYGQPCGPDACSRPCGNVMPCAEHPVTADCACKGKLERTGREEGKRPGAWIHAADGCGFDADEPYQPFVVHIPAEDLAAAIDHSDHECGAESDIEKLWCELDELIDNLEIRTEFDPPRVRARDVAEVRRLYDLLSRPSGDPATTGTKERT